MNFCKEKGIICGNCNENGYCKTTACIVRTSTRDIIYAETLDTTTEDIDDYQQGKIDAYNDVIRYLGTANGVEERCIKKYCEQRIKEQINDNNE